MRDMDKAGGPELAAAMDRLAAIARESASAAAPASALIERLARMPGLRLPPPDRAAMAAIEGRLPARRSRVTRR